MTVSHDTPDAWRVKTAATRVIAATNGWLHGRNAALGDVSRGHGCTRSALILKGQAAPVLHFDDSRLSGASLEPLTRDHRVILSSDETYLGQALGVAPTVEADHLRRFMLEERIARRLSSSHVLRRARAPSTSRPSSLRA